MPRVRTPCRGTHYHRPKNPNAAGVTIRAHALEVLQRPDRDGTPRDLGDCFHLRKFQGPGRKEARCRLFTHEFGFELRLEVNGDMLRSEVCREQQAVFDTFEAWKTAMIKKGWR